MASSFSLLIVDDEHIAREYVLTLIDYKKLGIDKVYEAKNGFEAQTIIDQHHPDMMLLDIRMPQMSGAELAKQLRLKKVDIQIVILSAYSDFEVAQKMISMGNVADYLLKPIDVDALTESLIKCIGRIEDERKKRQLNDNYEGARKQLLRRMVSDMIFGLDKANASEYLLPNSIYAQVGVCCYGNGSPLGFPIGEVPKTLSPLKYCYKTENSDYLILYFESQSGKESVKEICNQLLAKGWKIGLGRLCLQEDLNLSYQEAMIACEIASFAKDKRVWSIDDINNSSWDYPERDDSLKKLQELLKVEDYPSAEEVLSEMFSSELHRQIVGTKRIGRLALLKVRSAAMLESLLHEPSLNLSNLYQASSSYAVYQECCRLLLQKVDKPSENPDRKDALVARIKPYLCEHFMEQITLNSVAATFFISPSYLSRIFSETVGIVFTDYLTNIRIKKACELLCTRPDFKIYEIAEAVGYNSTKYFIKVFKEKTGSTPADYRLKRFINNSIQ